MSIAAQIKRARASRNLTQKELAAKAGIDAATISRLETGTIKNPSPSVIDRIAAALELDLQSFDLDIPPEHSLTVPFGFGHCMWAAPVIKGYCKDGGYPGMKITSYGTKTDENIPRPSWLSLDEQGEGGRKYSGPVLDPRIDLVRGDANIFNQLHPLPSNNKYEIFTADDLLQLVNLGELDCIAVPSEVYENNPSQLIRVASMTYTTKAGCYLCAIGRKDVLKEFSNPTELYQQIKEKYLTDRKLYIIHSERTIAEKYFRKYVSPFLADNGLSNNIVPVSIDLGRWDYITDTIKKLVSREQELFWVICWEPQLSWISEWIKRENNELELDTLRFDFSSILPKVKTPFVSFDILLKKDIPHQFKSQYLEILTEFFYRISDNVTQLNRGTIPLDLRPDAALIGQYLNMEIEKVAEELCYTNFRFSYYPDWIDWITE